MPADPTIDSPTTTRNTTDCATTRTANRLMVTPSRLAADTGYGSAEMLAWLVDERGIEPHIPVLDKSERTDGSFSRLDFAYDQESDAYVCPAGKQLRKYSRPFLSRQHVGLRRMRAESPMLPERPGAQGSTLHP